MHYIQFACRAANATTAVATAGLAPLESEYADWENSNWPPVDVYHQNTNSFSWRFPNPTSVSRPLGSRARNSRSCGQFMGRSHQDLPSPDRNSLIVFCFCFRGLCLFAPIFFAFMFLAFMFFLLCFLLLCRRWCLVSSLLLYVSYYSGNVTMGIKGRFYYCWNKK